MDEYEVVYNSLGYKGIHGGSKHMRKVGEEVESSRASAVGESVTPSI